MLHSLAVRSTSWIELKAAFIRTLKLDDEHAITPENSHLFAAMGSAMNAKGRCNRFSYGYEEPAEEFGIKMDFEVERMEPLFAHKGGL